MSCELIWVNHLEDLATVARTYQTFLDMVDRASLITDLEIQFNDEPMKFRLYGEDTEWALKVIDGEVHLVIEMDKED